jgi:hypothetical protein
MTLFHSSQILALPAKLGAKPSLAVAGFEG